MEMNWYLLLVTALIPLVVGSIYYNEKLVGGVWMRETGMTTEKAQQANMIKVFITTYLLGILISFIVLNFTVHMTGVYGLFQGTDFETAGTEAHKLYTSVVENYGGNFRSFGHGVIHGLMLALFLVWPVVSINAMFEQRGWRYVAIHVGYWAITLPLIGGVLCQWA